METKKSIALRYDEGMPAPFVAAKGKGELAEKLVALAKLHGVPVEPADSLAESLFYLDVGEFIPEVFYRAVAELLVFVWRMGDASPDQIMSRK
jgi:flagellar biosynthesis protein